MANDDLTGTVVTGEANSPEASSGDIEPQTALALFDELLSFQESFKPEEATQTEKPMSLIDQFLFDLDGGVQGVSLESEEESTQIETDESVRESPAGDAISYIDTAGNLTGGIGHLLTPEEKKKYPEGANIPQEVVNKWFEVDIDEADKDADRFFKTPNPELKAILINMAFNLGLTKLNEFKKMKAALEAEDFKEAAAQMKDSKWFDQVGVRAKRLVARMKALSK